MKLNDFISVANTTKEGVEIWLSNESFNDLLSSANVIRINEDGMLELLVITSYSEGYETIKDSYFFMEISLKNELYSENSKAYAELKHLTGKWDNINFTAPEKPKDARIL